VQVVDALGQLRPFFGSPQGGQKQSGQDRNDSDNNQQFDECEGFT
jgi:hypothetical protein